MTHMTLLASPLLAVALLSAPAFGSEPNLKNYVHWQQHDFEPGDWPEDLPATARARVEEWSGWARQAGYRMDLDPSGRVLMLCQSKFNRSVRREMQLVEETVEVFDELAGGALPRPTSGPQAKPTEVAVVVRVRNQADMESLLTHVGGEHPYLQPWVRENLDTIGARFWEPSVAAWIEVDLDRDEWRPENELVHQTATMLLRERFGTVPAWLEAGVAWNVELEVCRTIYAFPGRAGFVGVEEHKGWESALKRTLRKQDEVVLSAGHFDAWTPGTYDDHQAGLAWGMVAFLGEHRPASLGAILSDLGDFHAASSIETRADGSWIKLPEFVVPASVQKQIFRRWAGDDVYEECTAFLREGSRYRPSRR